MKNLKIAYLSSEDPTDVHVWSGIHYSIFNALKKQFGDVESLGPYRNKNVDFFIKIKKVLIMLFSKKRYNAYHSKMLAMTYGRHFSKMLSAKKYDLVVAVSASAELAYLETTLPIVFVSDALFSGALNYYKTLSNLSNYSIEEGFETERLALQKANLLYLPSRWAISNAINDFKIELNKIEIGYFGANLINIPAKEFVLHHKTTKDNSFINLIFVGVNWEHKGAPKAYACLLELLKMGCKAKLTIVGCTVPDNVSNPYLKNIPFIKKTSIEGRKEFENLYLDADFLILPTQFEAFGIVFCEASAYGVINIAGETGGTSSSILPGKNGYLLDAKSEGKDYAKKILSIYNDKKQMNELRENSRKRYDDELNWDKWAQNLNRVLIEKQIVL